MYRDYTAPEPGDKGTNPYSGQSHNILNLTCVKYTNILLLTLYNNRAIIFVFKFLFLLDVNYDLCKTCNI